MQWNLPFTIDETFASLHPATVGKKCGKSWPICQADYNLTTKLIDEFINFNRFALRGLLPKHKGCSQAEKLIKMYMSDLADKESEIHDKYIKKSEIFLSQIEPELCVLFPSESIMEKCLPLHSLVFIYLSLFINIYMYTGV